MDHSMLQTSRSNPPEVDSLFKRTEQVVSLSDRKSSDRQKPTCFPHGRRLSSKVGKAYGESKTTKKIKQKPVGGIKIAHI